MKRSNAKLALALAATAVVGFVSGFAVKSCIDFTVPIVAAYNYVLPGSFSPKVIKPACTVLSPGLSPVSYTDLFQPFDFSISPLDLTQSINQISNVPSIKTMDDGRELKLVAICPEIDPKNIQVDIEPNFLTIKGKQIDKEGTHVIRSESFVRTMKLPSNLDSLHAKQEFKDGVLTIYIPKAAVKATGFDSQTL